MNEGDSGQTEDKRRSDTPIESSQIAWVAAGVPVLFLPRRGPTRQPSAAAGNRREGARRPLDARLLPSSETAIQRIQAGLSKDDALTAFVAACNHRDTMFITDRWIQPRLDRLRSLLADPVTEDQAAALRELVAEKTRFDDVFDWLQRSPMSWLDYWVLREQERERARRDTMEQGIFPWPDVDAARADNALQRRAELQFPKETAPAANCPRCGQTLRWVFVRTPPWTWEELCGRAGWVAVCDPCHLQVDFELCVMN